MGSLAKYELKKMLLEMLDASDWVVQFNKKMDAQSLVEALRWKLGDAEADRLKDGIENMYEKAKTI